MAIIGDNDDGPKPAFAESLDQTLRRAIAIAQERHHPQASEEHLLLALTDDPDAAVVMRGCGVDLDALRRSISAALSYLAETPLAERTAPETSSGFKAIVQRAVVHVQMTRRDRGVTGADVLAAAFAEPAAAELLQEQGMTRYDATSYISHGTAKGDRDSHGGIGGEGPHAADRPQGLLAEVRLLNDDYTPMEFVVAVLERVFDHDRETATRIMLEIHNAGFGTCGVYPHDAAAAKVTEVLAFARQHQHPLHCFLAPSGSA
ncbi:MAG TPA: ATP-dependent Clp protease adaptor ClpS [Xanthobacteraceae bacterium]